MTALRSLIFIMTVAAAMIVAPPLSRAAETEKARSTIQAAVDEGLTTFASQSHPLDERARLLDRLLRRYSDPTLLAASILGRHWGKISAAEQAAFSETFLRYLVSSYVGLLKNLQPGTAVKVGDTQEAGTRLKVASVVSLPSQPGAPIPVEWELVETADGRVVVMDVTAEGISIIRAMREDFASVLRGSGGKIEPLMEALRRKIAENDQTNRE